MSYNDPITGSYLVLIISVISIIYIAFSALGGLILWACGSRIGKVENATFLNSWGLFWILHLVQIIFHFLVYFIFYLVVYSYYINLIQQSHTIYSPSGFGFIISMFFLLILYYLFSILFSLSITKGFWGCSFKDAFMTHFIPMSIFLGVFIIPIMVYAYILFSSYMIAPTAIY